MATISRGKTFGATEEVTASKLHQLVDSATITGIVNADIDSAADIEASKLALIEAPSTIDGGALTGLANIVAGAGVIPAANVSDANITFTDVSTNNASTTSHGFLKKLSNVATEFMNGVGNWVSVTIDSLLPSQTGNSGKFLTTNGSVSSWGSIGTSGFLICFSTAAAGIQSAGTTEWTSSLTVYTSIRKTASISTVLVWCSDLRVSAGGSSNAEAIVTIGGIDSGTATVASPYVTIDISSLTNGTYYPVTVKVRNLYGSGEKTLLDRVYINSN
jgi:hypothetical protein